MTTNVDQGDDDVTRERLRLLADRYHAVFAALSQEPDPKTLPSKSAADWVIAFSPGRATVVRPGKWLVFDGDPERVDALWLLVRAAVREGRLYAAKASGRDRAAQFGGEFLICVYTPDCRDNADVLRARGVLKEFGLMKPLHYKVDGAGEGVYLFTL